MRARGLTASAAHPPLDTVRGAPMFVERFATCRLAKKTWQAEGEDRQLDASVCVIILSDDLAEGL